MSIILETQRSYKMTVNLKSLKFLKNSIEWFKIIHLFVKADQNITLWNS